ncbi:hypothetical protein EC991_007709 [Linnemannia zychae]|nr:hypothetical protein EC991_007709 [Linnemannia zychae]
MVALSTLIWTSAKPIIKFVVLGGCGALMARHGLLTPAGAKVVAGLVLNYTLPALLFAKMLACVNQDNAEELVLVALVAVGIMVMGGILGLMIQRTGLVPKRLHWGVVAATMFTNFGDLPISIILAVSDHPPFLVGDGARGTAYSSVFIAVFYLFLFPFGGYKLIRVDHVKESKRLANLTTTIRNHENNINNNINNNNNSNVHNHVNTIFVNNLRCRIWTANSSSNTLHTSDTYHRRVNIMPDRTKEGFIQLQYQNQNRYSVESMASNGTGATRFSTSQEDDHNSLIHPPQPAMGRGGVMNGVSGGPTTRKKSIRPSLFKGYQQSPSREQHQQGQQQQPSQTTPIMSSSLGNMSRSGSGSPSPFISLTPPGSAGDGSSLAAAAGTGSGSNNGNRRGGEPVVGGDDTIEAMADMPFEMVTLGATQGASGPSSSTTLGARVGSNVSNGSSATVVATTPSDSAAGPAAIDPMAPLPKVPPQLQNSYDSKKKHQQHTQHWFWRYFHSIREYLTPPTIGLILGLICTLTPLRGLFVPTANPLPSPDELPPLSFIYEITLMLGGCCVPLGLTVLGASLSRLKPGRMRPLIPTLTMVTVAKMVISPLIGTLFVELVLVRHFQFVPASNHMLQFTLMLMSGSPTSMICFVLAQVWDRRTTHAGSEMAAVIAVQYAVGCVLITLGSAFMMYFLF